MGNKKTDSANRSEMRRRLRRWGMSEEDVKACVEQVKERQRLKNQGVIPLDAPLCTLAVYRDYLRKQLRPNDTAAAILKLGDDYVPPSDSGYKPDYVDPVLRGTARAVGKTAKAVKKGKTFTKHQYDKDECTCRHGPRGIRCPVHMKEET